MHTRAPSDDLVVLLDDTGSPRGSAARTAVHTSDTPLHLAFSSYLFDRAGRLLITRRALSKATWPGVWTNSCCGHPRPGEDPEDAARRRINEELGLAVRDFSLALPDFTYRATDASGIVENELCPVWVGQVDPAELRLDPDEVAEHAWLPWRDVVAAVSAAPQVFSPWAVLQVAQLAPLLSDDGRLVDAVGGQPSEQQTVDAVAATVDAQIDELARQWSAWVPDVEVLPIDLPAWLAEVSARGGKRFRSRLTHWGFVACGGRLGASHDQVVRAAAALELLHLFALVHDDVMDESSSRRGAPAAHVQAASWHAAARASGAADTFGRNLAILLGDLAHTLADRLVDGLPEPLRTAWWELCLELIAGQRADLTGAAAGRRDRTHAERVAHLKSGSYSVVRPLQLGALAAGATESQAAALDGYGWHVGRAFALRDDLLGLWGDPAVTGKPAGDDLINGKATVIVSLASTVLDPVVLQPPVFDVPQALRLLEGAGVPARVEGLIDDEVRLADAALAGAPLADDGVAGLKQLARAIAWRRA